MTRLDLPGIKALARAATSGLWGAHPDDGKGHVYVWRSGSSSRFGVHGTLSVPVTLAVTARPEDAAFMAAANPTVVCQLVALAERASTMYGFFRNGCIHESAAALVSLHATKAGAWRAMRAGLFAAAVEEREFVLRTGRRGWFADKLLEDQAFFIQPVEVLP